MFTELLYPLQDGYTPLHYAAEGGHTTCVEHLLPTPGIDVDTVFQIMAEADPMVALEEWPILIWRNCPYIGGHLALFFQIDF